MLLALYEMGEVWWSLLLPLASKSGGPCTKEQGFAELKRRIKKYYEDFAIDSRMPMKRFKISKIKSGRYPPKLLVSP